MKKILLLILASFVLFGCQSNDTLEETPVDQDITDPQIEDSEEVEEPSQDDFDNNDLSTTDGDSNDEPATSETEQNDQIDQDQNGNESDKYSSDDAINLVKEFIQGTDTDMGLNYSFDGIDDNGNYRIQVFEVVDHGEGQSHTATYGWYLVNPETGEITDLFAD